MTFQLIKEEIAPKVERLREERRVYMEFKRIDRELQHLQAQYTAWQYLQAGKILKKSCRDLEEKEAQIKEIESTIEENKEKAEKIDEEIAEIQQQDTVSITVSHLKFIFLE